MEDNTSALSTKKNIQTYISLGDPATSFLEIDLVTFREKNAEMRYLALSFSGTNPKTGEAQDSFINIDNEEAFNQLKSFFAQLEWNS